VDEIEAGNIRALVVWGGNPLTAFPNPERTAAALQSLDVLVVIDIFDKPLTQMATHALASADLVEHSDLIMRDRASYAPRVVAPKFDRRSTWWMFTQIGRRLGLPVVDGVDLDTGDDDAVLRAVAPITERSSAAFAAGPHGAQAPRVDGWVRENVLTDQRWRIAPAMLVARLSALVTDEEAALDRLRLVSRRQAGTMNSVVYQSAPGVTRRDVAELLINPLDAERHRVANGDAVCVSSKYGSVQAQARYDDRMMAGVVSLTHGWHDPNVNHLVSHTEDIDPLSGQPRMTGFPVTVAPLASAQ
jgi:anaerobic selenocysteine-containing dehydrogenase